jgi:hypothetical protein
MFLKALYGSHVIALGKRLKSEHEVIRWGVTGALANTLFHLTCRALTRPALVSATRCGI